MRQSRTQTDCASCVSPDEKELKEWLTEENLSRVALDLEACEDIEMISFLWRIYNRQAIRLASKQVVSHKADQINEWIQQLDAVI